MQVTLRVALGSFAVVFVTDITHDLTHTLLLPPALRPPVQNSSETTPEGQDPVMQPRLRRALCLLPSQLGGH